MPRLEPLERLLRARGELVAIDVAEDEEPVDARAASGDLTYYEFCRAAKAQLEEEEPLKPPPLVRGRDLLELGYPRGPLYSEILHAVEEKQLEGELASTAAALEWVRATYPI